MFRLFMRNQQAAEQFCMTLPLRRMATSKRNGRTDSSRNEQRSYFEAMILEFALDPGVLSDWRSVQLFVDKFGVENGRMISRFPSKWLGMVHEAAKACSVRDLKRIEEQLVILRQNKASIFVNSGRSYNPIVTWLENAEA